MCLDNLIEYILIGDHKSILDEHIPHTNLKILKHVYDNYPNILTADVIQSILNTSYQSLEILKLLELHITYEQIESYLVKMISNNIITLEYFQYCLDVITNLKCNTNHFRTTDGLNLLKICFNLCLHGISTNIQIPRIIQYLEFLGVRPYWSNPFDDELFEYLHIDRLDTLEFLLDQGTKFNADHIEYLSKQIDKSCYSKSPRCDKIIKRMKSIPL
jgi:hypothetical protein